MIYFRSKTLLSTLRKDTKKNGYSLVEMTTLVAIIGIISAIGLPALTKEQNKAKDLATIATLTKAAKECSLSLVSLGNNSNYTDSTTNRPFDTKFVNVFGNCTTNGKLTLVSPGRTEDISNNTHIAEVQFVGDVPQIAEFLSEVASL